jgi:transposase InsO family protein
MEKCLNRARDCLFWPGITEQIQDKVKVKEPLIPHQVPDRPWQILAADMFVLGKDKYLLLVDYYSKYFELIRVTDSTSNTVVNVLQQHLARYGLPEILYTDNGPKFASNEFFNFVRKYQFQHVTSSPTFPQSNGFVERTIHTAKKLLKKACDDGSDPHLALLEL